MFILSSRRSRSWTATAAAIAVMAAGPLAVRVSADGPSHPRLGQPASAEAVASANIDVFPNGEGLPAGSGEPATGAALFAAQCMECHGAGGVGLIAPALAGAQEPLTAEWPDQTIGSYWPYASTLFDFIRRAKPMNAPGTFSVDEIYALTAYLLNLNRLWPVDRALSAAGLKQLVMPNRDGFIFIDGEP